MRRYIGRGKGVPIRSYPGLTKEFFKKVKELNADYIFILDKPLVEKDFFEDADKNNIPIVWIDHHEIDKKNIPSFIDYYNPLFNTPKNNEPVTFLCYQISKRKEDLWLNIVGCIADGFIPEDYSDFKEKYPNLFVDSKNAFDIFYKSDIGKIARILGFALKDRTTNVINMIRFLIKVKNPDEILEENPKNFSMHKRFEQIEKRCKKLLEKAIAIEKKSGKILFFQYSGDLSISSDLANELSYRFPEKIIVVVYITGVKANISVRGKKIREFVLKTIEKLEDSKGGGHEGAVGAQIKIEDLEKFKSNLEKIINSP